VAAETDAARQRVLAARADLASEIDQLEASARAAVDIPAKVKRNPARAAAIAGGAGFIALGGPARLFRRAKTAVMGPEPPLPERMLPEEIEKALKKLGRDGDRIRGTLERDFADYVEKSEKRRGPDLAGVLTGALLRPALSRASRGAADWFLRTDEQGFQAQLERVRRRERTGEPSGRRPDERSPGR
jgi:hypothetical protein